MGMPGMGTSDMVAYSQPKEIKSNITAVLTHNNKMTVAELRNRINPITKYYDNWSAKSFIEDNSIDLLTKIDVIYGMSYPNRDSGLGLTEKMNEIRKVVA